MNEKKFNELWYDPQGTETDTIFSRFIMYLEKWYNKDLGEKETPAGIMINGLNTNKKRRNRTKWMKLNDKWANFKWYETNKDENKKVNKDEMPDFEKLPSDIFKKAPAPINGETPTKEEITKFVTTYVTLLELAQNWAREKLKKNGANEVNKKQIKDATLFLTEKANEKIKELQEGDEEGDEEAREGDEEAKEGDEGAKEDDEEGDEEGDKMLKHLSLKF